ncbi:hypothetical protein FBU30_002464 [Linnemannia zychae]|nr:hypothetical protein FBU30_002464 [Linnemannia zychae]
MLLNLRRPYFTSHTPSIQLFSATRSRSWIPQQSNQFHFSTRAASNEQQKQASTIFKASSQGPARGRQSDPKAFNTCRKAQRAGGSISSDNFINSAAGQVRLNRELKTDEIDKEIVRLFKKKTPWKEIDEILGLPHSKAYQRYYSHLDPGLKLWRLHNGQPNIALQNRLIYLVEVEKLSFVDIEKYHLMEEPWETPTPFAPAEVLNAAGVTESQRTRVPTKRKTTSAFNKVALQAKYKSIKALEAKARLRENDELVQKAVIRSVELYGENWRAVAAQADSMLDQWINPNLPRAPLTANKVASIYRTLQRTSIDWGLDDDVVITRKILALSRSRPDVLDVLNSAIKDTDKKRSGQQEETEDQKLGKQYWNEIAIAVGSHSPSQCQRRWKGLWNLHNDDKSFQSRSWHRFERFQFWMLWRYFSSQQQLRTSGSVSTKLLTSAEDLQIACNEISYSKEISRWMRHRNEQQCEKFFQTSIRSILNPSRNASHSSTSTLGANSPIRHFESRESLVNAITTELAAPLLTKMSIITPENKDSILHDRQQAMIRPDWTPELIHSLNEIVVQAKKGVQRGNFELNWDHIAQKLEQKHISAEVSTGTDKPTSQNHVFFTPQQCQNCWEFISTKPTAKKDISDSSNTTTSGADHKVEENVLQGWSDNEIVLLQQGVRTYGTLWADVRAQFLPNRDISDLQRAWFTISRESSQQKVKTDEGREVSVDRLSEPDYVGLLSALDKIGGDNSASSKENK